MKVLVVEDNMLNLRLFSDTLSMKGFEVVTARNGAEALEVLKNITPDLIILDLYMPGMSGFRFANAISKDSKYQRIPIIVVSASSSVYDVKEMASYNVKAYLVKPVSPTKLLETVKKVIIETEGEILPKIEDTKPISNKTQEEVGTEKYSDKQSVIRELETGIRISVDDVVEGMVLAEPVVKNRTIIYREGIKVDENMIEKMKSMGIREVYITSKSFEEFKDILSIKNDTESMIDNFFNEES
ncbi:MAG: response regulator [Brevinematia bacterium]